MARPKKPKQQTIEATLGQPRLRSQKKAPRENLTSQASRGGKKQVADRQVIISTVGDVDSKDDVEEGPVSRPAFASRALRASRVSSVQPMDLDDPFRTQAPPPTLPRITRASARQKKIDSNITRSSDSDDDDDLPLPSQRSLQKRRIIKVESDDEDEEESVGKKWPPSTATKRRRLLSRARASLADDGSPLARCGDGETPSLAIRSNERENVGHTTTPRARPRLTSLTAKEKKREMLRRRKAGEPLEDVERGSPSSSAEEERKALYDTDSDAEYAALKDFDDDEEGLPAEEDSMPSAKPTEKKKNLQAQARKGKTDKRATNNHGSDSDDNMEDFVEDDGTLGVPDHVLAQMPLQFTSLSHKPIREHFKDVVAWLVWFRLDPGFGDKQNPLYRMGWRKVDDEVMGLAQSKFISASWKPEFLRALRARPNMEETELLAGDPGKLDGCGACGRSKHPASFVVCFTGSPYHKRDPLGASFLQPVEVESSSDELSSNDEDDDEESKVDHDENDEPIPPETTRWMVGKVCYVNAKTAHTLLHWKHSLKCLVELWLGNDGYLSGDKLAERDRATPKNRKKLVRKVLDDWEEGSQMAMLWDAFQDSLQKARQQKTDSFGSREDRLDW